LAALFFSPAAGGSHGIYTPGTFDLHLDGGEGFADQLVHHHEAQHVVLTATTAWGSALTVTSRVPRWAELFRELLDCCRITHESYATYMSCSVITAAFGSPAAALASYPQYVPLVERLERYLAVIPGDQRRSLAVTALARACMQTPILEQMVASWPGTVTIGSVRAIDIPDERLNHLLRDPDGFPAELAASADAVVADEFGPDPLAADLASGSAAVDERFGPAWARWEDAVFDALAARLAGAGATVVRGNDHLSACGDLVGLVKSVVPELDVTVIADPDISEQRMMAAVLDHARLWLSAPRRPARMITVGKDLDVAEAVRVADATTRVGGRPNLVLHARLPARLLAGYQLPEDDRTLLAGLDRPVLVSRTIADDGTDTQHDVVWLVRWDEPPDVAALATLWDGRGDLTCCVAASSLADTRWRADWLPVLQEIAPIVWLIDVPIEPLAEEFGAEPIVYSVYLDLDLTPSGARQAVAFKVPGRAGTWLALADDVGVQMITQQVASLPGVNLRTTGGDWTSLTSMLRLVLLDLLHTESYVDLRALPDRRS
jgi:hypothetical protein